MYKTAKNLKSAPTADQLQTIKAILDSLISVRKEVSITFSGFLKDRITTYESVLIDIQLLLRSCNKDLSDIYLYDLSLIIAKIQLLTGGITVDSKLLGCQLLNNLLKAEIRLIEIKHNLFTLE